MWLRKIASLLNFRIIIWKSIKCERYIIFWLSYLFVLCRLVYFELTAATVFGFGKSECVLVCTQSFCSYRRNWTRAFLSLSKGHAYLESLRDKKKNVRKLSQDILKQELCCSYVFRWRPVITSIFRFAEKLAKYVKLYWWLWTLDLAKVVIWHLVACYIDYFVI